MLIALLLGLIQGCTEFLPVSSTGHLALASRALGQTEPLFVAVAGHAGTAMAALWAYRREYVRVVRGLGQAGTERRFAVSFVIVQAGTAAVAGPLALTLVASGFTSWYSSPLMFGPFMLLNAAVLATAPRDRPPHSTEQLPALHWRAAFGMGLLQGFAALPGLSRSGVTIAAGLWFGLSREDAAHLSYLIAPPVMVASLVFWLPALAGNVASTSEGLQLVGWQLVGLMPLISCVVGIAGFFTLRGVVAWVRRGRLWWFSPWSAAVGVAALLSAVF